MARVHDLKTWPGPFQAVWDGIKRHEIRVDDRGYVVGDYLLLNEYDPMQDGTARGGRYTDRALFARVTYMTPGGQWGLPVHVCVMSIEVLARDANAWIGCFDRFVDRGGT